MARITAKCMGCGAVKMVSEMVATACANRGANKVAYMCKHCATHNDGYQSMRENGEIGGVENGFRFGIELETNCSTDNFRNMMFRYGFEATHDGSLNDIGENRYYGGWGREASCEYVSPTNKGLKRFTKQFIEIENYLNNGEIQMDDSCGTHCHISYNNMENGEMAMICNYFQSLFTEIQNVMIANPEKTKKFFGRYFCHYAPRFYENTHMRLGDHDDRYCWVNCTNHTNIEFRLNKFVTAEQMRECIKFEQWMTKTIIDNFTSKYNNGENRKELAKKTGAKLAKKLAKIYAEM